MRELPLYTKLSYIIHVYVWYRVQYTVYVIIKIKIHTKYIKVLNRLVINNASRTYDMLNLKIKLLNTIRQFFSTKPNLT